MDWRNEDNTVRPHSALGYLTPTNYAKAWTTPECTLMSVGDDAGGRPQGPALRMVWKILTDPVAGAALLRPPGHIIPMILGCRTPQVAGRSPRR